MDADLLFGLAILLFAGAWALWMLAIASANRAGMIGGAVVAFALSAAIVVLNGERSEEERGEIRAQIERFIEEVRDLQDARYESEGSYANELPPLSDELATYDGGLLQQEKSLDPTLTAEKNQYTVTGQISNEIYTLSVERTRSGAVEETRTCDASASAGCIDGQW